MIDTSIVTMERPRHATYSFPVIATWNILLLQEMQMRLTPFQRKQGMIEIGFL